MWWSRPCGLPIGNLTSQFFANIYLHPLDLFVKHELGVKGYVRYVDDFLLFGDGRAALKAQGRSVKKAVQLLRLRMHPDKYRFGPTECGVDFVGFVMYPDGRVRMRDANVRRFERRFKRQAWAVRHGRMGLGDLETRTRCWVAHASHAQSYGLRQDLFRDIDLGHRDMNNRGLRGGAFNNNDNNLRSSNRNNNNPTNENNNIGFRVASLRKAAPA